jgi:Anti-sigma-K factor rskA/Putative zinc-finger
MSHNRECGADAAAYVLGALETAEVEAFRAHLATCVICRDEVASFQEVADQLPLTAPVQPVPGTLKRRVMAEVNADARAHERSTRRDTRGHRRFRLPPGLFSAIPTPALALSAVVLVLAVTVGAIAIGSAGGGSSTRVFNASVTWPGSAKLRVTDGRGELIVHGMPAPPASKVYEVWVQRGQRPPSPTSTLFSVTSTGSGSVDVPGSLHGVSRVLVTPEPLGGSRAPTHPPVLVATIS